MKTLMQTRARKAKFALAAGIAIGAMSAQPLFAGNYYWNGGGSDTLFSTGANWAQGQPPPASGDSLHFEADAVGKTVTIDREHTTSTWLWLYSDTSGEYYNPDTGAINPVVWEATQPKFGINHSGYAPVIGWGGATRNGALVIRSGTYTWGTSQIGQGGGAGYLAVEGGKLTAGLQLGQANSVGKVVIKGGEVLASALQVGAGGTGTLLVEGGTLSMNGDPCVATAAGAKGEIVVGTGDPNHPAVFNAHKVAGGNNTFWLTQAAGAVGRLTIKKGGVVNAMYIGVQDDSATIVLDGGTLGKTADFNHVNTRGHHFGYYTTDHLNKDKNLKFQITENGGTFDLKVPTCFAMPLRLAEGAKFAKFRNAGPGKLTLVEIDEGIGIVFGDESEIPNVEIGGSALPTLEIAGGSYLASADAVIGQMPAHTGKVLLSGGRFFLPVNAATLQDGVPVATDCNVNDFQDDFELADGVGFEDLLAVEPAEGFEFTISIDESGVVSYVPHAVTGSMLPLGYTPLSYIRANGCNHYFLTGCAIDADTSLEMDFGDVVFNNNTVVIGLNVWGTNGSLLNLRDGDKFSFWHSSGFAHVGTVLADADYRMKVSSGRFEMTTGSSTEVFEFGLSSSSASDKRLAVFALNNGGYAGNAKFSLYRLKIRNGAGLLQRYFVPCQNERGEVGMFDLVTRRFFGKSGVKRFLIPSDATNFVPIDDGEFASEISGTTLVAKEGVMTALPDGITHFTKSTPLAVDASAVKDLPAVSVQEGVLSVEDGEANEYAIDGALTLAGGTHLVVDLVDERCDTFVPTSVDLSQATAENPIYIVVNAKPGASLEKPRPIIPSGVKSLMNRGKFKLICDMPAKLMIDRGALVLADPDAVPVRESLTILIR